MNNIVLDEIIIRAINFDNNMLSQKDISVITDYFIDFVCVTIAGSQEYPAKQACLLAQELGKAGKSSFLGRDFKISSEWAAFGNGVACHILDWDDMYWEGLCHLGSFIFNTALSICQDLKLSGKKLIIAAFLGYEFAMRISRLQIGIGKESEVPKKGFDVSSTVGCVTSAFVAAKLMNLTYDQFIHALGLAVNQASGVYQAIREKDATYSFAFHHGWAPFSGIIAAKLALKGFQSDRDALFGDFGYMNAFAIDKTSYPDTIEPYTQKLYHLNSIKFYPACAYVCSALTALFSCIEKYEIDFEQIKHVRVFVTEAAYNMCYLPEKEKLSPLSPEIARLSLPFCIASAICDKKFSPAQTNINAISNKKKLNLAHSIEIIEDKKMTAQYQNKSPVRIILETPTNTYEYISIYELGHYLNPITKEQQKIKFSIAVESIVPNTEVLFDALKTVFFYDNINDLNI